MNSRENEYMRLSELREMVTDREAWHAAIHGVPKSWTRLSDWTELNWRAGLEPVTWLWTEEDVDFMFLTSKAKDNSWLFYSSFCICLYIFIFNMLGLCCCVRVPCSYGEWGASPRCGPWASHCGGLHCPSTRVLQHVAVACGLSSRGSQAREWGLSSSSTEDQLLHSMWDPPRPGIKPLSLALAGRLSTTEPPRKSLCICFV